MITQRRQCESCKWIGNDLKCHRWPMGRNDEGVSLWPNVMPNDWCAEWIGEYLASDSAQPVVTEP